MKNINKIFFKILALVILICGYINLALGQVNFSSEIVKEIYLQLPESTRYQINTAEHKQCTNIYTLRLSGRSEEISVRYNSHNELEHIGLNLIDDKQKLPEIKEVFDFIERAFLHSIMSGEEYLLKNETEKFGIEVLYNGSSIRPKNTLMVVPNIDINKQTPLEIKYNSETFQVKWALENKNELTLRIPNDYFLITGEKKDELEMNLLRKISESKDSQVDKLRPHKSELNLVNQSLFCMPGNIYSTTPELSSNKYFIINDSIYPVFDINYYKESVRNLFLNILPSKTKLNITLKMYGGKDEKIKLNINNFYTNFAKDYNIYFGWQNDNKDNLKASIFFKHKIYNYNHLLVVTTNIKSIFGKNCEIDGILISYIPQEKINESTTK